MKMKSRLGLYGLVSALSLTGIVGCSRSDSVADGVVYSMEYQMPGSGTYGFTRMNDSRCVPGGNGSWNVDAYGRLTREYLIITYPQNPHMGPLIIPASRLVSIQFGDGGIAQVAKQTNP